MKWISLSKKLKSMAPGRLIVFGGIYIPRLLLATRSHISLGDALIMSNMWFLSYPYSGWVWGEFLYAKS